MLKARRYFLRNVSKSVKNRVSSFFSIGRNTAGLYGRTLLLVALAHTRPGCKAPPQPVALEERTIRKAKYDFDLDLRCDFLPRLQLFVILVSFSATSLFQIWTDRKRSSS